jgi:16S rRNA (guanine(966)-N(2))-methyltransferase RsmD
MRVISGTAKGRSLVPPNDRRVRPTSDRTKEALFSIIGSLCGDITGFSVLDIFDGTGSLGIEALSRGADKAVFIDNQRSSAALIKTNLNSTGFARDSEVLIADAEAALVQTAIQGRLFNLVFADPPYSQGIAQQLLRQLGSLPVLADGALVVIETSSREDLPQSEGELKQIDRRIYGDTALTFYSSN